MAPIIHVHEIWSQTLTEPKNYLRFNDLAKHVENIESLHAALNNVVQHELDTCLICLNNREWQHDCFKSLKVENTLIVLYCQGLISKKEYLQASFIVLAFQHFGFSENAEDIFVDIYGASLNIVDLIAIKETSHFADILNSFNNRPGQRKRIYCLEKLLFKNFKLKHLELIEIQLSEGEMSKLTDNSAGATTQLRFLCNFLGVVTTPVWINKYSNSLYLMTPDLIGHFVKHQGEEIAMSPILGITSADALKQFRERGEHPVAIHHHAVSNNFERVHGHSAKILIPNLHDLYHCLILGTIETKWRKTLLAIDGVVCKMQTSLSSSLIDERLQRFIDKFRLLISENKLSFNEDVEQFFYTHIHVLNESFIHANETRPFLDQEVSIIKGQSSNYAASKLFKCFLNTFDTKAHIEFIFNYIVYNFLTDIPTEHDVLEMMISEMGSNCEPNKLEPESCLKMFLGWKSLVLKPTAPNFEDF